MNNQRDVHKRLLNSAGTALDLALGFFPVIASISDTTHILFGSFTGHDYFGNSMADGDYALRGLGIVLGLLPGNAIIRFGGLEIGKSWIRIANTFRSLLPETLSTFAKTAGQVLTNENGAVGQALGDILKYQRMFPDEIRFKAMMSALKSYNDHFTEAGRALTKHPEILGFKNTAEMRTILRTHHELNEHAAHFVSEALTSGVPVNSYHQTLDLNTVDYVLQNGMAARFSKSDMSFITFVERRVE